MEGVFTRKEKIEMVVIIITFIGGIIISSIFGFIYFPENIVIWFPVGYVILFVSIICLIDWNKHNRNAEV